jgi:hypothetical protein
MKSPTVQKTAAPEIDLKNEQEMEEAEREQKAIFEELARVSVDKYRQALSVTKGITERDVREHEFYTFDESTWKRRGDDTYEKRIETIRKSIDTYIPDMILTMMSLEQDFFAKLDQAEGQWISRDSAQRWRARLESTSTQHWEKEQFLQKEFPSLFDNWKKVGEDREDVIKLAKQYGITGKDIAELNDVFNKESFLDLHYLSKVDKVSTAKALILARIKNKEGFIGLVRKELEDWAKAGWMHKTKIGPWMKRVMESDEPEAFATKTLWPFKSNWMEARQDFDRLNTALGAQGIPRGFRPVKPDQFLLMNYKQRTSYCALTWIRLENAAETDKELASLKLSIRHNLDMKDWEGATIDLTKAKKMRSGDRELLSMESYIQCHRTDVNANAKQDEKKEVENPDPQKLVEDLRSVVSSIPGSLGWLYQQAALDGIETLSCLQQIVGNGPWAEEHGFTSEADKVRNMYDKKNREATKNKDADGVAHVILEGETATEDVISDDPDSAQYLYLGTMGREAVLQKVKKNAGNMTFRYWAILVSGDMSLAMQSEIARNRHYPMKSMLRKLNGIGYRFTLSGKAEKIAA